MSDNIVDLFPEEKELGPEDIKQLFIDYDSNPEYPPLKGIVILGTDEDKNLRALGVAGLNNWEMKGLLLAVATDFDV